MVEPLPEWEVNPHLRNDAHNPEEEEKLAANQDMRSVNKNLRKGNESGPHDQSHTLEDRQAAAAENSVSDDSDYEPIEEFKNHGYKLPGFSSAPRRMSMTNRDVDVSHEDAEVIYVAAEDGMKVISRSQEAPLPHHAEDERPDSDDSLDQSSSRDSVSSNEDDQAV